MEQALDFFITKTKKYCQAFFNPNLDSEKRIASSCENLETFSGN